MKRVLAIASVVALVLAVLLLHSAIKDFLWTHPWWHSFLVAVPTIALPILAYFELRHSSEANTLRADANDLRSKANELQGQIANLTAELSAERNKHLEAIARNTEKSVTPGERNAAILRKHQRARVAVYEEQGNWPNPAEIAEVSDDNIVTLFTPCGHSQSVAWCVRVQCVELEISDIPQGSCPLRLKVLKRYGPTVTLGEIVRWEDRLQPAAIPAFPKSGGAAHYSFYMKDGSSETRSLHIYPSSDGANSYLLEASTGEKLTGDNIEISKKFLVMQVEYEAAGFRRNRGSGPGSSPHRLFVC